MTDRKDASMTPQMIRCDFVSSLYFQRMEMVSMGVRKMQYQRISAMISENFMVDVTSNSAIRFTLRSLFNQVQKQNWQESRFQKIDIVDFL
jgi:hypothetical protein